MGSSLRLWRTGPATRAQGTLEGHRQEAPTVRYQGAWGAWRAALPAGLLRRLQGLLKQTETGSVARLEGLLHAAKQTAILTGMTPQELYIRTTHSQFIVHSSVISFEEYKFV